jgi:uncharacterized protein (DUF305 family)
MHTITRSGAAVAAAALVFTLAACGNTDSSQPAAGSTAAATTAASTGTTGTTGATGMMSGSVASESTAPSPSASAAGVVSTEHNATDLTFAQSMIVHHQGAIEMADLAATRAASQQVKDLAARIKAAQGPEIEQMQSWLTAWGAAMSTSSEASDSMGGMDHGGMDHGGSSEVSEGSTDGGMSMPGMMTDEQMQQLGAASGAAFDRMFLEMMIMHHQGAIEMADTEIAGGMNPDALALAESITTSQTAEITEMQKLLQSL